MSNSVVRNAPSTRSHDRAGRVRRALGADRGGGAGRAAPRGGDEPHVRVTEAPFSVSRGTVLRAPLCFMHISRNGTRILSDCTRIFHCARILRKFRENTVAPYATLPYARASKAHRPTKQNLLNLLN